MHKYLCKHVQIKFMDTINGGFEYKFNLGSFFLFLGLSQTGFEENENLYDRIQEEFRLL